MGRIIRITQEVIEYRRWIKDLYANHSPQWQFESNLASAMYASYNSASNPFSNHNLTNSVAFSSEKRSLNLNMLNNQLINSFIQQQHAGHQQQNNPNTDSSSSNNTNNSSNTNSASTIQSTTSNSNSTTNTNTTNNNINNNKQQLPFIQGFPMAPQANLFPVSYFNIGNLSF